MLTSQRLRPEDIVRFATPHFALAPIAGLQLPQPAESVGGLVLVRCNRAEWETAERAYVFKDWHKEYYRANPVFLFRGFEQPLAAEEILHALEDLADTGRRLVTALRLLKPGHVLEPAYTARFVVSGMSRTRAVGPYRTEYLAMPVDGFTWTLEDGEADTLDGVLSAIERVEAAPGHETLLAIIDQFNLSHTPLVSSALAVHLLLTAAAMVFDHDGPGGTRLRTTMYDRARAVMQWATGGALDPSFEAFYRETVRPLRNAVHHHALAGFDADLDAARAHLQWSLRVGIRLLMRLHLDGAATADATPWQVLNAALDRQAAGDRSALDGLIDAGADTSRD